MTSNYPQMTVLPSSHRFRKSNYERTWKIALDHCGEVLGEDSYESIVDFDGPEKAITAIKDLEDQYARNRIAR